MLRVDSRNPRAVALVERLRAHVDLEALDSELCIVVGGDGWMLTCIRELGEAPIYLGINAGHLGFLLNDVADIADVAAQLRSGEWRAWAFPRLHLRARLADGTTQIDTLAVNDLYIERSTGQTAHLRVRIDGQTVVDRLICDGLLVSTALGSTAYSYSAGGVPCHPLVRVVHITPICPHLPRLSPFIVPEGTIVEVEALQVAKRPVRAVADGIDQGPVHNLRIEPAAQGVRIAFLDGHAFTRTLIHKVLKS